jgi:hypothetical protein
MGARVKFSAGIVVAGLLAGTTAAAQAPEPGAAEASGLRRGEAMIMLDYQVIEVPDDEWIDLMGFPD